MQPNIKTQTVKGADLLRQNSGVKIYADKYYHITEVDEKPKRRLGFSKGKIKIMPDFDEPLEEFKEYM